MIARRITSIFPIPSSRIGCAGRHYSVLLQDKIDIVPKKMKEEKNIWKLAILEELKEELRVERQQYSKKYKRRLGQAQIVRYAMVSDLPSIISYAHKYILEVSSIDTAEDDEFISISLLLLQRDIRRMLNSKEDLNSRETFATFFLFAKMWDRIQILGPNTGSVTILLIDTLDRWSHMRKKDDKSSEIDKILLRIRKRLKDNLKHFSPYELSVYISPSDRKFINQRWLELCGTRRQLSEKCDDFKYDGELTLLSHFREPFPEENYHGNQYKLDEIQKEEYLRRFPTQLATEKMPWLRVENFGKSRKEGISMSAEQLIESWDWKGRIECSLERMRKDQIQNTLKGYLSILSISELSTLILESVLAVCSQGQEFIQFSLFQYSLVSPLIQLIHNKFIERIGVDEKELWTNVFSNYISIFDDPSLSRLYTHREWWHKSCSANGIPPDYQPPFGEFLTEARKKLGYFFIQVCIDACKFPGKDAKSQDILLDAFSIRNVAIDEESQFSNSGRAVPVKMISIDSQLINLLDDHQFDYVRFATKQLPMIVPPRPWSDYGIGGPDYTRRSKVLRNIQEYKAININAEVRSRLHSPVQARPVFDALNQLGATPWKINEPMLDVLCQVFTLSGDPTKAELLEKLSIPMRGDTVTIPNSTEVFGTHTKLEYDDKEKWRVFIKNKSEAIKKRNELNSLWYWFKYRIVLARHFRRQTLFFPHSMDFRGRVYPISPYLSHMGDDVNRCILKFARGKPLGSNGLSWLKLHCINLTGKMKRMSIEDRLRAAEEQMENIIDSACRPLDGKRWWIDSEEPWQTLAACMELRDALSFDGNTNEFISNLAVHQDGSCNGLQHYAALGRDQQGGQEVNLMKSETPNDVYSSVAFRVELKRLEDEKGGENMELARRLREVLPQAIPRKVIKQTVMTTVYGVRMYGAVLQIKRQLKALGIEDEDVTKFATYLAHKTFASLNDAFTSSMQLKDWLRTCAKGACELIRPVEWITPLGLPVVQPYMRTKSVSGKVVVEPISTKQIDAFPPNLVHSLDSTHMMLTSLNCSRRGLTFAAVHDCFWTHASTVEEMNKICREQFVSLHSLPIIQQYSDWFLNHYLSPIRISQLPPKEVTRLQNLFAPNTRPGQLNIKDVQDSLYFFS